MLTAELKKFYLKTLAGMNAKVENLDLKDRWVEIAQNCRFEDEPGAVDKRDPVTYFNTTSIGAGALTGLSRFYTSTGTTVFVGTHGTAAYVGADSTGTFTAIRAGLTSGKRHSFVTYKDLLIASSGYDNPWVYDGSSDNITWELGACKAKAVGSGGSLGAGNYYYAITIGGDAYVCGAVSNTLTAVAGDSVTLTNIPLGPAGTSDRKVYRTAVGGSALLLLATISNNTATTYTDTIADGSLGAAIPSVTDDMPLGSMLKIHRERLFLSGDPSNPNKIPYSFPYLPHYIQVTTQLSFMSISPEDGDEIMGIPIQLGVMVCIKKNSIRKLHITSPVSGADPTTWYADDPIAWIGSPATWSITQTPSGIMFLGWDHWYLFDGASAQPIIDEFDTGDVLEENYSDVVGHFHNGVFLAAYTDKVSGAQTHNRIMRYNFKREALAYDLWTSTTLTGANCFASRVGDDEVGDLYYGDSANGYVIKDKDSESNYRLRTKSEVSAGTSSSIFIGGTENAPYIEAGTQVSSTAIPDDVCIFWDQETAAPGAGWTEVTGYEDRLIQISSTSLTTSGGISHSHLLTGSIPMWTGLATTNVGDGNPGVVGAHSHEVSYPCDAATPFPRNVKFRIFKKNSVTTEYEFPDGAIIMYDQASAPPGWQMLDSYGFTGYYAALATTGLFTVNSSVHTHIFDIPTGTAAGNLAQSDAGTNSPGFGHDHIVVGELSVVEQGTWELDSVGINFIKKIGESDSWDGINRYCYVLYASASTPGVDWTEISSSYPGKFLKIASTVPTTAGPANASHTHVAGTFTTSSESTRWGNGGYHATNYASPHTHQVTLSASSADSGIPPYVTFRLFKRVLGQMKPYNDAGSVVYNSGTWTSPAIAVNAESFDKIFWNQTVGANDSVALYIRTGATQAACEAATFSVALTNPNGTPIPSAVAPWIQYKIVFTITDSTVSNPRVYFTNGYVVHFTYHAGATNAETSVNFQYSIGFRNFDEPSLDKIYKKIATKHEGTDGSFTLNWETENSNDSFVVSLNSNPQQWDSYFQSTAMGKEIDVEILKNDLFDFRISEIAGFYSPCMERI